MNPAKALIFIGLLCIAAGLVWWAFGKIPFFGRLPGDIRIQKDNFTLFFPLGTCLLLSAVISFLLWLFRR